MHKPHDAFLSLRDLRKTYGATVAIEHVSLDIRQGEFMTFLGPSGSGKSTTLYITAGFEDPTQGLVLLNQKNLHGGSAEQAQYWYGFPALHPVPPFERG